jgi:hypothetical protein
MSMDGCDAILRQVCLARGVNPARLLQSPRATREQLIIKGEAINRMREARATWITIARVMFYRHHSQAMHARRAYLETKGSVLPDAGTDAPTTTEGEPR